MDFTVIWVEQLGAALLQLVLNPFYYFGLLIVALLYRRQVAMERKLFAVRLHAASKQFFHALLWGWIGGIVISLGVVGTGIVLNMSTIIWIWAVTIILLAFRVRFACLAYAAGIIGILHTVVDVIPGLADIEQLEWITTSISEVHPPSLFALVALLHLVEAVFIRIHGARNATPLFVEGKRGKVVGAYHLQGFWAIPLFLVVPFTSGIGADALPWPMFFGGSEWNAGWSLLAFPALIGFSQMTITELPEQNARRSAKLLFGFAMIMGILAVASEYWSIVTIAAGVLSIALHEVILMYSSLREKNGGPYFVQATKGLKLLAVVPGSPAANLGIMCGEIILKANGFAVNTKEELHAALRTNTAFCKLEVLNLEGQNKFMHRALFDGEHHLLGLIIVPDERVPYYMEWRKPFTLLSLLVARYKHRRQSVIIDNEVASAVETVVEDPNMEAKE
ncbi:MAG: PDZ domain-containing protein [Paenibacillaceae bacterium]